MTNLLKETSAVTIKNAVIRPRFPKRKMEITVMGKDKNKVVFDKCVFGRYRKPSKSEKVRSLCVINVSDDFIKNGTQRLYKKG